jgi:hypothetical protein
MLVNWYRIKCFSRRCNSSYNAETQKNKPLTQSRPESWAPHKASLILVDNICRCKARVDPRPAVWNFRIVVTIKLKIPEIIQYVRPQLRTSVVVDAEVRAVIASNNRLTQQRIPDDSLPDYGLPVCLGDSSSNGLASTLFALAFPACAPEIHQNTCH